MPLLIGLALLGVIGFFAVKSYAGGPAQFFVPGRWYAVTVTVRPQPTAVPPVTVPAVLAALTQMGFGQVASVTQTPASSGTVVLVKIVGPFVGLPNVVGYKTHGSGRIVVEEVKAPDPIPALQALVPAALGPAAAPAASSGRY